MSTKQIQKITRFGGARSNLMYFPETASQTFKEGQPVYITTAGRITACAAGAQAFLGIAAMDAQGTVDLKTAVDVIKPGDWFVGNVYHATAASAVCADASVGLKYGFTVTSNIGVVNIADVSTVGVKIVARMPEDSATDVYARVVFAFISTYVQSDLCAQV